MQTLPALSGCQHSVRHAISRSLNEFPTASM
jgi:hypothetical protein